MLPAAHRLRRADDFRAVSRRGRRTSSSTVLAQALPRAGGGQALVGFVVGKSVGRAVQRNRVKRRMRHAVRPRLGDLESLMVVFRAKPESARADYARLQADVDACCSALRATVGRPDSAAREAAR